MIRATHEFRAGTIGAGFIGAVHAVGHSFPAVASHLCVDGGTGQGSGRGFVSICSPNVMYGGTAEAAWGAGKPAVSEKPLATHLGGARLPARLTESSRGVAIVPFLYRFYPMVRELRHRAREGEGGEHFSLFSGFDSGIGWPSQMASAGGPTLRWQGRQGRLTRTAFIGAIFSASPRDIRSGAWQSAWRLRFARDVRMAGVRMSAQRMSP